MHVNPQNANQNIQIDKSLTDQKVSESEASKPKKPSLHQKEKKEPSSENSSTNAPIHKFSTEEKKKQLDRLNQLYKAGKPNIAPKKEQEESTHTDLGKTANNATKIQEVQEAFACEIPQALGKIAIEELRDVVFGEKCFPQFANTREGGQFVAELMNVVDKKMSLMKSTDKGMALVFRFPCAYGPIGHVAVGSLWRNNQGQLQLDISHQESIAPGERVSPRTGKIENFSWYTGQIFDNFDTHKYYPGKIAPVVESMKLLGLPSVNVFPVSHPEVLRPYTQTFMKIEHFTPYGATLAWGPVMQNPDDWAVRAETCFNVFYKTWGVINGERVNWEPTLPNVFIKIKHLLGIPADAFTKFSVQKPVPRDNVPLEEACKHEGNAVPIFVEIGKGWINSGPADVNGKIAWRGFKTTIDAGTVGVPLSAGITSFKFNSETANLQGLTLHGEQVIKDKVYTADEARQMRFQGSGKPKTIDYVAPLAASVTGPAKL